MKRFLLLILAASICVVAEAQLIKSRSSSVVTIEGKSYYIHTVKKGETLYSLSKLYGTTEESIRKDNPQAVDGLQPGQVLKIQGEPETKSNISPRKLAKLFDRHTVNQGETAYSISKRYGITVAMLIEDNPGLDPAALKVGQELNIRKSAQGEATDKQIEAGWQEYRDAINSVSNDFTYHLVAKGETLYSLSKTFGVSQDEITKNNDLKDGLKTGSLIKIPNKKKPEKKQEAEVPATPPAAEPVAPIIPEVAVDEDIRVKDFRSGATLDIALMLPLGSEPGANRNFTDFYQGVLLGLEDLKAKGISANLNLYNTGRSAVEVEQIVSSDGFGGTDLIIGPVYEENIAPVLSFARREGVPVVSPLAVIEKEKSPLLYQMSPDPAHKYDKLKELLSPDKNVVLVSASGNDKEFAAEIEPLLPQGHRTLNYSKEVPAASLENLIRDDRDNVFVILSGNENTVDEILARISSVQNNLVARSIRNARISVVGSSKWIRFQNVGKDLYFKLNLNLVTSYYADRSNRIVAGFDKRYVKAFGTIPSLYSYRGYDAVKLFAGAASQPGRQFEDKINEAPLPLLQMPYRFAQSSRGDNHVNDQWALVRYLPDFTIEVK